MDNKYQLAELPDHCAPCWGDKCSKDDSCFNEDNKNELEQKYQKQVQFCNQSNNPLEKDECLIKIAEQNDKKLYEKMQPQLKASRPTEWNGKEDTWLNTINILEVLARYENHKEFHLLGVSPKDWNATLFGDNCVTDRMCKLNMEELYKNGIRYLGGVFNLDNHNQQGSHWNGLFVNMKKAGIYFSDSYGTLPNEETGELMNKIESQGNELILKGIINYEDLDKEHQSTFQVSKIIDDKTLELVNTDDLIRYTPTLIDGKIYIIESINNNIIKLDKKLDNNNVKSITQLGFRKYYNNIRQQYGGSECGIYSIDFITRMLVNGDSFYDYSTTKNDDKSIMSQRKNFYY